MQRRSIGFGILALALIGGTVLAAATAPARAGTAARATPPDPPVVGSCGNVSNGAFEVLDCAQPHDAEVVYGWSGRQGPNRPKPSIALCNEAVREYVGSPPAQDADAHIAGSWSLPLRYRQMIATGPGDNRIVDWSWQVCVVSPIGAAPWRGYEGSIRSIPVTGATSAALRACYLAPGEITRIVPCSQPHAGEIVATQPLNGVELLSASIRAGLAESCAAQARSVTGAADATYSGELRVVVLPDPDQPARALSADLGVYYTATGPKWSVCAVERSGDRPLLGSVAGLGNGPLPLG